MLSVFLLPSGECQRVSNEVIAANLRSGNRFASKWRRDFRICCLRWSRDGQSTFFAIWTSAPGFISIVVITRCSFFRSGPMPPLRLVINARQQIGDQVRKGESGIAILAPVIYKRKREEESDKELEKAEERLAGFRVRYVFDASQLGLIDGKSLPAFWQELPDDQEETYAMVKGAVEACGIQVEEGMLKRGAQGVSHFMIETVTRMQERDEM